MSNARVFWVVWCVGWAVFWFVAGLFTFLLSWLLVPIALLAILIPVGGNTARRVSVGPKPWWPQS